MAQDKPARILFKWDQSTMEEVGFTQEQIQRFEEIQKETNLASSALRKDASLTAEQKKEKMNALVKERRDKQYSVLTPEQLVKTKAIIKRIQAANAAAGY